MKFLSFLFGLFRKPAAPKPRIVVDGSNVMHWGGDPSVKVLHSVLADLSGPIVFFDANVGYKLMGKHMDAEDLAPLLGLTPTQITIAPSGTQADGLLLDYAAKHRLRVVSNDRFRDWTVKHRWVRKKGRVVRGDWKSGRVVWAG